MTVKVCLIGNDGAGKTTLANIIRDSVLSDAVVVSFANTLKEDLQSIGVPANTKPFTRELRNFIRSYGDLMRQLYGNDYWANRLLSDNSLGNRTLIVDDMRYWSEFNLWTHKHMKQTKVITVGPIIPTAITDAQSVIQVNELLRVLRLDTSSNMLHLPSIKTMPPGLVIHQLNQYLIPNNK